MLDEFLSVLKTEKSEEGGHHGTHDQIKPVVEGGLGPEHRPEGLPTAEGIMEEKPAAVLKLIPQHPKEHQKDNHNYGSDIAAGRLS